MHCNLAEPFKFNLLLSRVVGWEIWSWQHMVLRTSIYRSSWCWDLVSFLGIILDMLTEQWYLTKFLAKSTIDFAILSALFSEAKTFVPTVRKTFELFSQRQNSICSFMHFTFADEKGRTYITCCFIF